MIQLETYKGTKSRHTCPACNSKDVFVRYVDENGEYISSDVGRCNRESKCGYHYKPKQYFADNPTLNVSNWKQSAKTKKRGIPNYAFTVKNGSQVEYEARAAATKPHFISFEHLAPTIGNYERNAFVQFLFNLFPDCVEEIQDALKMYFVGTHQDYTCFPSIDRSNHICRAKLIRFNPTTGKRLKGKYDTSSLVRKLKLKEDFQYKQIFFGEHLLTKYPNKPVAIVEAEKTAIIASLCFPEFVWLGCNSKQWLKVERLQKLRGRKTILYPDGDGFNDWQKVALQTRLQGLTVQVSNLIENRATSEQKVNGYDLADYLISQQTRINEVNKLIDLYNSGVDIAKDCQTLSQELKTILNERISIIKIHDNLSWAEAERAATTPENIQEIVSRFTN
jgi:hypothetical protein